MSRHAVQWPPPYTLYRPAGVHTRACLYTCKWSGPLPSFPLAVCPQLPDGGLCLLESLRGFCSLSVGSIAAFQPGIIARQ